MPKKLLCLFCTSMVCVTITYCTFLFAATSMQIGNNPPLQIDGDSFATPFVKNKGENIIRISPKPQKQNAIQQNPQMTYPQIYVEPKMPAPSKPHSPHKRPKNKETKIFH